MKKMLLIAVAMILVASVASAASIVYSKHDMRSFITNETSTEVCVYCHTPHQAGTSQDPLWNHSLSSFGAYGAYTSATSTVGTSLDSTSNTIGALCMSCHDGTVAVNSLFNPPNLNSVGTATFIFGAARLGTDLTNDHPVEFSYATALSYNAAGVLNTGASVDALLIGGNVTCASCHQVHDPQFTPFLRVTNANSQLCLTCHNK